MQKKSSEFFLLVAFLSTNKGLRWRINIIFWLIIILCMLIVSEFWCMHLEALAACWEILRSVEWDVCCLLFFRLIAWEMQQELVTIVEECHILHSFLFNWEGWSHVKVGSLILYCNCCVFDNILISTFGG